MAPLRSLYGDAKPKELLGPVESALRRMVRRLYTMGVDLTPETVESFGVLVRHWPDADPSVVRCVDSEDRAWAARERVARLLDAA